MAVKTSRNITHENAESGNRVALAGDPCGVVVSWNTPAGDPCGVVVSCISPETQIEGHHWNMASAKSWNKALNTTLMPSG